MACYDTPEQVTTVVKQRYGLALTRQRIEAWRPEQCTGVKLGARWRTMFYDTRAKLPAELDDIPFACQIYRLRMLDRVAAQSEAMDKLALAAPIIEQTAKEVGAAEQATQP